MKWSLIMLCLIILPDILSAREPNSVPPTSPGNYDYSSITEVIPPSPNAASLGKFGGVNVGKNTGTINFLVPIYDVSIKNVTVPVSLSYSSGGMKVDELPTVLGTSWNLNAGGVINRTVAGAPDESSVWVDPPTGFPNVSQATLDFYLKTISKSTSEDWRHDIFKFNFGGFSGSFILDKERNVQLLEHSDLSITKSLSVSGKLNFIATDGKGTKYYFGFDDAIEQTKNNKSSCQSDVGEYAYTTTAWYLSRIENTNGEWVNFSYEAEAFKTMVMNGISQSMTKGNNSQVGECGNCAALFNSFSTCTSSYNLKTVRLLAISSSSGVYITFGYELTSVYQDGFTLCNKIWINRDNGSIINGYDLLYQTRAPTTTSSNIYADNSPRKFLIGVNKLASDGSIAPLSQYKFNYYNLNNLPSRFSYAQDHWGFFNGKTTNVNFLALPEAAYQVTFPDATANRNADENFVINGSLSKIEYPTGGFDELTYESNKIGANVTGGLRIRQIKTFDGISVTPINTNYYYTTLDNLSGSGEGFFSEPKHMKSMSVISKCIKYGNPEPHSPNGNPLCFQQDCDIIQLSSNTNDNLYIFSTGLVSYRYVVEMKIASIEKLATQ